MRRGSTRVINNLPRYTNEAELKAYTAVTKAVIVGAAEAAVYTPTKTSNLLNGQFRSVGRQGDVITGTVGYTANYAPYVHDPEVKQNFVRSTAKKEFLKLGFEENRDRIDRIIAEALKT